MNDLTKLKFIKEKYTDRYTDEPYELAINVETYFTNELCIQLYAKDSEGIIEPFATLTTVIAGETRDSFQGAVNADYIPGIIDWLERNRIAKDTGEKTTSGFNTYHILKFSSTRLFELDKEGTKMYREHSRAQLTNSLYEEEKEIIAERSLDYCQEDGKKLKVRLIDDSYANGSKAVRMEYKEDGKWKAMTTISHNLRNKVNENEIYVEKNKSLESFLKRNEIAAKVPGSKKEVGGKAYFLYKVNPEKLIVKKNPVLNVSKKNLYLKTIDALMKKQAEYQQKKASQKTDEKKPEESQALYKGKGKDKYTKEELERFKEINKEKMDALTAKLENGIKEITSGEQYKKYLDFASSFYNYSYRNQLLIMMQKPDASLVASYSDWQKKYDRQVTRGQKAIQIIAPCKKSFEIKVDKTNKKGEKIYDNSGEVIKENKTIDYITYRVASVYDVGQTVGSELPVPVRSKMLEGQIDNYNNIVKGLSIVANVPVAFDHDLETNGVYMLDEKSIVLKDGMSQVQTVKTLCHEIAHAKLHGHGFTDRNKAEVQAESVAYIIARNLGIDSADYSFAYVANWGSENMKEFTESLNTIQNCSGKIIGRLNSVLKDEKSLNREYDKYLGKLGKKETQQSKQNLQENAGASL